MEAEWERNAEYVSLTLEDARKLLAKTGFQLLGLRLITEGKRNTNYRIETQFGPFFLRLGPRDAKDWPADYSSFLTQIEEIPMPSERAFGPGYRIDEWIEGISLEQALIHRRSLPYEKIGRQLAQARLALNAERCTAAGFLDSNAPNFQTVNSDEILHVPKESWPSAIEGLYGWLRHLLTNTKLSKPLRAQIVRVTDDAEPRLQAIAGPPVIVHGDFKPSNLLVDETGITAVLDWEYTHAGTWLSDVGQLLRHPETLPPALIDAFCEELKIDADTVLLARTLDLTNLVSFLHEDRNQPKMRAAVTARIEEVCGLYERRFGKPS